MIDYLERFFDRRRDLDRTLESIIITHNHIDHTRALRRVVETFRVRRFIDSGHDTGTGTGNPNWVRRNAAARDITTRQILDTQVQQVPGRAGLTDEDIDPLRCEDCDPEIRILSGRHETNPGWPPGEFGNKNNHSLVIRVDFGESSFLFTGDLEDHAADTMVDWYENTDRLDVDVYQVGHHGSHNGSALSLVEAMSPAIAVISMGRFDDGRGGRSRFATWFYGHPRRVILDRLQDHISGYRSRSITVRVADKPQKFKDYRVRKRVYGTGWEGTVKVRATLEGRFRVTTRN